MRGMCRPVSAVSKFEPTGFWGLEKKGSWKAPLIGVTPTAGQALTPCWHQLRVGVRAPCPSACPHRGLCHRTIGRLDPPRPLSCCRCNAGTLCHRRNASGGGRSRRPCHSCGRRPLSACPSTAWSHHTSGCHRRDGRAWHSLDGRGGSLRLPRQRTLPRGARLGARG